MGKNPMKEEKKKGTLSLSLSSKQTSNTFFYTIPKYPPPPMHHHHHHYHSCNNVPHKKDPQFCLPTSKTQSS
jgi:hypothetical protein